MRYCKKCVLPDTRPYIKFNDEGICYPCLAAEKVKNTDWNQRWKELEELADKYRGSNGDYYDCIITVSPGKDSYYQIHIFKESKKSQYEQKSEIRKCKLSNLGFNIYFLDSVYLKSFAPSVIMACVYECKPCRR